MEKISEEGTPNSDTALDGSQTERIRGTYGGRQRWLTDSQTGPNTGNSSSIYASPRPSYNTYEVLLFYMSISILTLCSKLNASGVSSFLTSMGYLVGEETQFVDKEVNEVSSLRREFDALYSTNAKKEKEIRRLENEIQIMSSTMGARVDDSLQTQARISNIENKSALYESKLEEETSDRGVYNHMIQRLTDEALEARKATLEKEKTLVDLENEVANTMASLIAARQEETAAKLLYQKMVNEFKQARHENYRASDDVNHAVNQTQLMHDLVEQRQCTRAKYSQQTMGESRQKESRRLRNESQAQMQYFSQLQKELAEVQSRLTFSEAEYKNILEAAGTADLNKIIEKYNNREETLKALMEEHATADVKMRKLRDKHNFLKDSLNDHRNTAVNTRTVYQDMDSTGDKLKEIEKDSTVLTEKCNRANVMIDAFRACLLKCLHRLSTVQGSKDDEVLITLNRAADSSAIDLLHTVENKLGEVLDVINRERAERELHRTDVGGGNHSHNGNTDISNEKVNPATRGPEPSESEEHFILRMSSTNTSASNIRVRPKSVQLVRRYTMMNGGIAQNGAEHKNAVDNPETQQENEEILHNGGGKDTIISRETRKKLVGLIVNRARRGKTPMQSHHR
ncbi:unnamed protein product [Albugo candida]|uniref:Uncharacterized protein n=1 Tax=Albugo candida TaxID=65357 RepID=A0A024GMV1_9STRA|nr:unnamed protein product [Albugo candida]|eukprot:CCI48216.1 unnamed protein product [Albugo candida]